MKILIHLIKNNFEFGYQPKKDNSVKLIDGAPKVKKGIKP